jgi:D-alanyl-D-alanine carboxypeptidase
MEQVSETERKGKPLLLHDIKHLGHIKSESYAVFEYPSAQLILSYRSKQAMEIASLTKIMTCYMIIKMAE